jgi:hypothetical protein
MTAFTIEDTKFWAGCVGCGGWSDWESSPGGNEGGRLGQRVARPDAGEITEVIIEGVILLHNYHNMLYRVRGGGGGGGLLYRRTCHSRGQYAHYGAGRSYDHYRRINPPQSCASRSGLSGVRISRFRVHF